MTERQVDLFDAILNFKKSCPEEEPEEEPDESHMLYVHMAEARRLTLAMPAEEYMGVQEYAIAAIEYNAKVIERVKDATLAED